MTELLWVLAIVLVIVGLAGVLLPALPGTVLIFAGLLLGAWADSFTRVGALPLIAIGLIGASSYLVDFVAAALGAKHLGASPRAMAGAAIGTVAGFFLGIPGIILGPFVGAVIGELTQRLRNAPGSSQRMWPFAGSSAVKPLALVVTTSCSRPAWSR